MDRLVTEHRIDRLFVRGRVVRFRIARLDDRRGGQRVGHVEDARLVAGNGHHHQLGHHPVPAR